MEEEGYERARCHTTDRPFTYIEIGSKMSFFLRPSNMYANRIPSNRIRYVSYRTKPIRLVDDRSKNMI